MNLQRDQIFPHIVAKRVGGGEMAIPEDLLQGQWSVLLFYRGHWWGYCNRQLADFQSKLGQFSKIGTQVVALSVDSEEHAQKMVQSHNLTFPVLYELDAREMAATIGAYISENKAYMHATGFILRPDKTIELSGYSSGPISRIAANDAISMIDYLKRKS